MSEKVTMYSTTWCGYCQRLKAQMGREGIEYNEVDIEQDSAAADFVMSVNGGMPLCRPWCSQMAQRGLIPALAKLKPC